MQSVENCATTANADRIGFFLYNNSGTWNIVDYDDSYTDRFWTDGTAWAGSQTFNSTGISASNTTLYVEVKRTSATAGQVSVSTNSDYTTSASTKSIGSLPSSVAGLRYLSLQNRTTGSHTDKLTGTIADIKFWNATNDTTATPTYTATSNTFKDDKSIVTDVPTGSQFEEVDTRKFYQISVGDGSAQNTNIFNLTYSTEKQATITSGNDPTGKCVLTHTGSNPESKAWTTELTSGSTKTFEIKFTVARGSNDTGNNWGMFIGSDVWDDNGASGSNKRIGFRMVNGNRVDFILDSGSSTSTEDDTLSLQGTSTTKYYTITGNGTSAKCEYCSTSARSGTPDDATGNVSFPTGWLSDDAFDTITFGAWGGGSNAINVTFNEVSIKWDSGVATTWVERGTAI